MQKRSSMVGMNAPEKDETFYRWASALALITVVYNVAEGVVSVFLGFEDGTISLVGFGVDSFVEVISGIGIWHMVTRMRNRPDENPDSFERTALKVTGGAFYLLAGGLVIIAVVQVLRGSKPETTVWGVIISGISIATMWLLAHYKRKIGSRFQSEALLADAACTKTCLWLSVVLLLASLGYEETGLGLLDSAGALGIAWLSYREGQEAFERSRGNLRCACQGAYHQSPDVPRP